MKRLLKENVGQFMLYRKPVTNTQVATMTTVKGAYEYITSVRPREATERLRTMTDAGMRRHFKAFNFDFALFSGTFRSRTDAGLVQHSSLLCLDFDHLGDRKSALRQQLLTDKFHETVLLFESPSGDGLKWVVYIDLDMADHGTWFNALSNYIRKEYGVEVDSSCRNVSRACFLPYDPDCHVCPAFLDEKAVLAEHPVFDVMAWAHPVRTREATTEDTGRDVLELTDLIVQSGRDITEGYENWLKVGFAIADALGEEGRDAFHRISSMNPQYRQNQCDHQYNNCLKGKRSGITYKTLFFLAKDKGVDLSRLSRREVCASCAIVPSGTKHEIPYINNVYDEKSEFVPLGTMAQLAQTPEMEGENGSINSHTFSDKLVREELPSFLLPVLDSQGDAVGRDKMLLASLNVISGLIPETLYSIYDRKKIYPPLYNIVYGRYATSKGDMESARHIATPIKGEMLRQYEEQMVAYEKDLGDWEVRGKGKDHSPRGPQPKEPVRRSPFVSANSSASAVYRGMNANGGWGLIFDTEADTMSNMLSKSDYGDYTEFLRKAHHHEECSMVRVTEKLNIELEHPRLSVFLTCTGSQIPTLLSSQNVSNGLASRFLFYEIPQGKVMFRDVFDGKDKPIEDVYIELGMKFMPLYHALETRREHPIQFIMSKEQQENFVTTFNDILHEEFQMMGDGIQGYIFRMALECYRYCMVLTALRRLSEWNQKDSIFDEDEQAMTCDERDYRTAKTIINCLINHTARVFAVIATEDKDPFAQCTEQPSDEVKKLFAVIPSGHEVKTADIVTAAESVGIPERTAKRFLGLLCSKYSVMEHIRQGVYYKRKA